MDTAKKIKNLLVGDGSKKNYQLACDYFNEPVHLLDNLAYENLNPNLSYFTSLKDLELDKLLCAIEIAIRVEFGIFKSFSNYIENRIIDTIIYEKNKNYKNLLGDTIEINSDEIVFLGCSHTVGVGVEKNQRFSQLASKKLGLKEKNLAVKGSGIWQMHDTFFRCKFNKNQKVVLQISDPYRINYFSNQKIEQDSFKNTKNKKLLLTYNDSILSYQEYSLISSIILSSKSQGINLLCFRMSAELPHEYDHSDYLLTTATNSFILGKWLDLGSDNWHSGPLTHKKISSIIIKKFKGIL